MTDITELVDMGAGKFAVRRTVTAWAGLVTKISFMDLQSSKPVWRNRDDDFFERCLTSEINKAKTYMATYGRGVGEVIIEGVLTAAEIYEISNFAIKNEPVRDLLLQAKELFILSK